MPYLVLDLEAIEDPELPPYAARGSGDHGDPFPPPPFWQVVCIGAALLDGNGLTKRIGLIGEGLGEATMLAKLVDCIDRTEPVTIVGVNSRGYDLPVIAARCLRHAQPFGWYYAALRGRDPRYRFSQGAHFDLTDYLSDHGGGRRGSLDTFSRLCGFPGKGATDGGSVAALHTAGELERIGSYCMADVAATAALLLRTKLLTGEFDREQYRTAATSLLAAIDGEPRLADLAAGINRRRFLLSDGAPAEQPGAVQ